jgi:hypothetical protein
MSFVVLTLGKNRASASIVVVIETFSSRDVSRTPPVSSGTSSHFEMSFGYLSGVPGDSGDPGSAFWGFTPSVPGTRFMSGPGVSISGRVPGEAESRKHLTAFGDATTPTGSSHITAVIARVVVPSRLVGRDLHLAARRVRATSARARVQIAVEKWSSANKFPFFGTSEKNGASFSVVSV